MSQIEGNRLVDSNVLQPLLLILLAALIAKILHSIIDKLTAPLQEIPSPPGHFLLGHQPVLVRSDLGELYEYWMKHFSRNGMVRTTYLGQKMIILSKPEHLKKVLVSESTKFSRPDAIIDLLPIMKYGLFGAKGKEHAWQRKLLHPSFTSVSVKQFAGLFMEKSSRLVKLWTQKINKGEKSPCTLVVEDDLSKLMLDIISMAAFGHDINTLSDMNDKNSKALQIILERTFSLKYGILNKYFGFLTRFLTLFGMEDVRSAQEVVDKLVSEVIVSKVKKLNSPAEWKDKPSTRPDLLELMMKLKDEETGDKMSENVLKGNVFTFMVAGYDTSSTCLTWTLYLLALHGDKQDKAREEVLNASPRNSDITVESIERMPYVEYVLKESLRLYPPGAVAIRETLEPVTLGDVTIPKGYGIRIPVLFVQRSENFWTEPLEFKPERFDVDETTKDGKKDIGLQYMPFTMGPRGCIGNKFAMLEMRIVMAFLLKNFKFCISPNHPKVKAKMSLTLKPVPSPEIQVELVSHS